MGYERDNPRAGGAQAPQPRIVRSQSVGGALCVACDRHAELDEPELASHLDEPGDRQRRHVLRRLRLPLHYVVYRLDTEAAGAFLGQYVTLP